jgi:hypothetical protein
MALCHLPVEAPLKVNHHRGSKPLSSSADLTLLKGWMGLFFLVARIFSDHETGGSEH